MQQHISLQLGIAWVVVALIIGVILLVTAPPQMRKSGATFSQSSRVVSSANELNNAVRSVVIIHEPDTEEVNVSARIGR